MNAVIPVRLGSSRVPEKNVRPFTRDGRSLLQVKVDQLREVPWIESITVMGDIKPKHVPTGVTFIPLDASVTNAVSMSGTYRAIGSYFSCLLSNPTLIAVVLCTNPLFGPRRFSEFIRARSPIGARFDSYNSANLVRKHLFFSSGKGLNFSNSLFESSLPPSQTLPEVYSVNWAVSVISPQTLIKVGCSVGHRPHFITSTDPLAGFDIDTPEEFETAQLIYGERSDT
jgi:CMP-N-acetylneuraminic acid synthetase